jgi:hypothetical protein
MTGTFGKLLRLSKSHFLSKMGMGGNDNSYFLEFCSGLKVMRPITGVDT